MVDSPRCSGRIEKGRVEKEGLDRDVKQGLNSCVRLSDALDGLTRSVSLLVVSVNKGSRDRPAVAFDASPPSNSGMVVCAAFLHRVGCDIVGSARDCRMGIRRIVLVSQHSRAFR